MCAVEKFRNLESTFDSGQMVTAGNGISQTDKGFLAIEMITGDVRHFSQISNAIHPSKAVESKNAATQKIRSASDRSLSPINLTPCIDALEAYSVNKSSANE